jgi:hypothetical protein
MGGMNSEPPLSTHRLGKIARLPAAIRQKLNERLEDNEPAPQLLAWLHSLPEVGKVLQRLFEGRAISEQNLSAWKQGGFRDWQRHQQVRARAHEFLEEGRELAEEVAAPGAGGSLLDRVGDRLALTLLELFREAEAGEPGPERTRTLLAIAREVARLRRGDHERQQAEVAEQRWRHERDLTLREVREHEEEQQRAAVAAVCAEARELRAELIRGLAFQDMLPERGPWICQFFSEHEELLREHGIPGLPKDEQLGRELAAARREPGYVQHRYEERAEKEAATAGRPSPVKAAQGKSRSKNSAAEAGEAAPEGGAR